MSLARTTTAINGHDGSMPGHEDEAFRIEDLDTGDAIRVEVGIELDPADFIL